MRIYCECSVWLSNQTAKQMRLWSGGESSKVPGDGGKATGAQGGAKWYLRSLLLCAQMLQFVRSIQYYLHYEVFEPNWYMAVEKDILMSDTAPTFPTSAPRRTFEYAPPKLNCPLQLKTFLYCMRLVFWTIHSPLYQLNPCLVYLFYLAWRKLVRGKIPLGKIPDLKLLLFI